MFLTSQVTKCVKAVLSHHAGVHLMELNDQWGRDYLHHAAAAVCHYMLYLFKIDVFI